MGTESQLGEAFVPIRATLDKLDGDLKQARSKVEGAMKGMEDKSGKAGGALQALGTNVNNLKNQVPALGTAFSLLTNPITLVTAGIGALGAISKEAIGKFSDLNETVSKVGVVFGEQSKKVLDFGKTADTSLGMSENAALSAAGTYGNLFRSMGMVEEKSADMSIGLVNLAGDLASFNNMDPTEVMDKLRAGLSGETEPLKSLGININETILKEKALEMGLWDGKDALDASAKAQAAYALIMQQTTLAQGDFARTSGGLANQQRILAAEVENLTASLGEHLYPVAVKIIKVLVDLANAADIVFEGMDNQAKATDILRRAHDEGLISEKEYAIALRDLRTGSDEYKTVIEKVITAEDNLQAEEDKLIAAHSSTIIITEKLTEATDNTSMSMENAKKAMGRLNEYINGKLGPNEEKFTETQDGLNTKMGEIQGDIDKAIKGGYDPLGEKVLDLKGKYADLKKQYDENATAHEEDTKRIILGILAQEMAAMGFSDSRAFAKIASDWGLIDEATMNAMLATDKAINWLRDHPGEYATFEGMMNRARLGVDEVTTAADNAALAIDKITGQHEVGIHVTVSGDEIPYIPRDIWIPGEDYIPVATGFEGWVRKPTVFVAGEDNKPEYVSVMPQSERMELKMVDTFGGAGMAMADHRNQLQQAAEPFTINLYAVPEKEKDMRRQARYIVDEIKRRGS
ncbi:MAG: hypothetical protein A2Y88_04915 [Chloroflexi bacterium RBG_13_48_10]|nr:MAG: hypothetical protein A2Y88_04915 [Chloroflexi bacterium RBG_13_48_10]